MMKHSYSPITNACAIWRCHCLQRQDRASYSGKKVRVVCVFVCVCVCVCVCQPKKLSQDATPNGGSQTSIIIPDRIRLADS